MLHRRAMPKTAAGLPLAAVLADPMLIRAIAAKLDTVTLNLPSGHTVGASWALPDATLSGVANSARGRRGSRVIASHSQLA